MSLFSGNSISDFLGGQLADALNAIDRLPADEVLFDLHAATDRILAAFVPATIVFDMGGIERSAARERIAWNEDRWGGRTKIRQAAVTFEIPFTGDKRLLYVRPSTYTQGGVLAELSKGMESVFFELVSQTTAGIEKDLASRLAALTTHAERVKADVDNWVEQVGPSIRRAVEQRKDAIASMRMIDEELTIPIRAVDRQARVQIPLKRTSIPMPKNPTSGSASLPEPEFSLSEAIATDVIERITSFGRAVERMPLTADKFSEPELRDILLFVLNSNYQGQARGEVFNGIGKSDILLTWEDRNAFIGECKIWSGESDFERAIDQLLGYVIWRDARAALVLFIKDRKSPTDVVKKAVAKLESHDNWKSSRAVVDPLGARDYLFSSPKDPARNLTVTFVPFVISA